MKTVLKVLLASFLGFLLVAGENLCAAGDSIVNDHELEALLSLINDVGRSSPDGALMVWADYAPKGAQYSGDAAGVYFYGDDMVRLLLEERTALPDGRYQITIWKFYRSNSSNRASVTELIKDPRWPVEISLYRYEEAIAPDSPEAAGKSAKTIQILMNSNREALKNLPLDIYMRPFESH